MSPARREAQDWPPPRSPELPPSLPGRQGGGGGGKESRGHLPAPRPQAGAKVLFLLLLQLLHDRRLKELTIIKEQLSGLFRSGEPQVWAGDYNALTREDYGPEEWERVGEVRARGGWERPLTEVTSCMASWGFTDCWAEVGRPGEVSTCRYRVTHNSFPPPHETRARQSFSCARAREHFVSTLRVIVGTLAYLAAKILMGYLLKKPRYWHLKFVWRIAPIWKTKFQFSLASYIWWRNGRE